MAANIKLKRSAVQSRVPTTTDLELGELGLNTYDGKVYMKKDDGTAAIVEVGGGGGGAVDSVNTQTGAVSLGIEDLDDFELQPNVAQSTSWSTYAGGINNDGEWALLTGASAIAVNYNDDNGVDQTSFLNGLSTIKLSQDGVNFTQFTIDFVADENSKGNKIQLTAAHGLSASGTLYIETQAAVGNAPLANGDILQYVSADSKFKPAQLPTAVSSISDLNDVSIGAESEINYTSFDSGQTSFTDPNSSATGGAIDTTLSTNAWKVLSSESYGDGSALVGFLSTDKRYDIVNLRVRSSNNIDTNNRLALGGNRSDLITTGGGFALYTRDSGFGFAGNNSFEEIGTKPTMLADTWYEITYVLDWASAQRATKPKVSLWVDGAIAISDVTLTISYAELTGVEALNFRIPWNTTAQSNSGDKYWDDISVVTGDTIPWSMTASTITNPAALMNAEYGGTVVSDGDILQWVDANSRWEPVAASSGSTTIDDLTDVDTSTVAPTDGQALVWDNANSQWEPGTIASSSSIQTATDFELQPATGTTPITRTGASQSSNVTSGNVGLSIDGSGYTYWSVNPDGFSGTVLDHLVNNAAFPIDVDISGTTYTLIGVHDSSTSATPNVRLDHDGGVSFTNGVSYTLSLASAPTLPLQNNDVLQWVDADSVFKPVQLPAAVSSIDDLGDVDTSTVTPTDGQVLVWDNASSQWEPGAVASSIQTASDFDLNPAGSQRTWTYSSSSLSNPGTGLISNWTGTSWMVNITDKNGDDASAIQSASGVLSVTVYIDGVSTYTGTTLSGGWANQNGTRSGIQFADDSWKSSLTGGEEITLDMAMFSSGDQPLADGDILQYVSADSKFKPVQLPVDTNLSYTDATRVLASSTGTNTTLPLMSSANAGLVPASGGGTANFLRADGTFAAQGSGSFGTAVYTGPTTALGADSTSYTTVNVATAVGTPSGFFSNSSGQITLSAAGTYLASCTVVLTGSTANYRWTGELNIEQDTGTGFTEIGSVRGGYIRVNSGSNDTFVTITRIVTTTASNESLQFQLKRISTTSGNATYVVNNSTIQIAKIDGVPGATGATGADGEDGPSNIPQNLQSGAGSYTLQASDDGKHINTTQGGVSVPSGVFSAGDVVSIFNDSTSDQTITQGGGVTLRLAGTATTGNRTLAQYGLCTVLCVGSNDFVISGAGLS